MRSFLTGILLFVSVFSFGQNPKTLVTSKTSYITDLADVYTPEQEASLDAVIRSFYDTVQFAVVTTNDLAGLEIEDYAVQLFNDNMHVGSTSNNGVLIVICPNCHLIRTATGAGVSSTLKGALTDLRCGEYQRKYATPRFKEDNYYAGTFDLLDAYMTLMSPARQEIFAAQEKAKAEDEAKAMAAIGEWLFYFVIIAGAFIFIVFQIRKANRKKLEAERKAQIYRNTLLSDYKSAWKNIRIVLDQIQAGTTFPEYTEFMKNFNLSILAKIVADDKTLESLTNEQLETTIATYRSFFQGINQKLYDTIRFKVDTVTKAKNKLDTYNDNWVKGQQRDLQDFTTRLDNMVFNKDKNAYERIFNRAANNYVNIVGIIEKLEQALIEGNIDTINSYLNSLTESYNNYRQAVDDIKSLLSVDNDKQNTAQSAKDTLFAHLNTYAGYCKRSGVSDAISERTRLAVNALLAKLKDFDGLDLIKRYNMYGQLTIQMNNTCMEAKNAYDAYEKEQARLRKIEQDRLDEIERQRQAEIRRQREAEEARQRAIRDEADRQYRAQQAAADDARRASESNNNSVSFGGGMTDGGGATSSW